MDPSDLGLASTNPEEATTHVADLLPLDQQGETTEQVAADSLLLDQQDMFLDFIEEYSSLSNSMVDSSVSSASGQFTTSDAQSSGAGSSMPNPSTVPGATDAVASSHTEATSRSESDPYIELNTPAPIYPFLPPGHPIMYPAGEVPPDPRFYGCPFLSRSEHEQLFGSLTRFDMKSRILQRYSRDIENNEYIQRSLQTPTSPPHDSTQMLELLTMPSDPQTLPPVGLDEENCSSTVPVSTSPVPKPVIITCEPETEAHAPQHIPEGATHMDSTTCNGQVPQECPDSTNPDFEHPPYGEESRPAMKSEGVTPMQAKPENQNSNNRRVTFADGPPPTELSLANPACAINEGRAESSEEKVLLIEPTSPPNRESRGDSVDITRLDTNTQPSQSSRPPARCQEAHSPEKTETMPPLPSPEPPKYAQLPLKRLKDHGDTEYEFQQQPDTLASRSPQLETTDGPPIKKARLSDEMATEFSEIPTIVGQETCDAPTVVGNESSDKPTVADNKSNDMANVDHKSSDHQDQEHVASTSTDKDHGDAEYELQQQPDTFPTTSPQLETTDGRPIKKARISDEMAPDCYHKPTFVGQETCDVTAVIGKESSNKPTDVGNDSDGMADTDREDSSDYRDEEHVASTSTHEISWANDQAERDLRNVMKMRNALQTEFQGKTSSFFGPRENFRSTTAQLQTPTSSVQDRDSIAGHQDTQAILLAEESLSLTIHEGEMDSRGDVGLCDPATGNNIRDALEIQTHLSQINETASAHNQTVVEPSAVTAVRSLFQPPAAITCAPGPMTLAPEPMTPTNNPVVAISQSTGAAFSRGHFSPLKLLAHVATPETHYVDQTAQGAQERAGLELTSMVGPGTAEHEAVLQDHGHIDALRIQEEQNIRSSLAALLRVMSDLKQADRDNVVMRAANRRSEGVKAGETASLLRKFLRQRFASLKGDQETLLIAARETVRELRRSAVLRESIGPSRVHLQSLFDYIDLDRMNHFQLCIVGVLLG